MEKKKIIASILGATLMTSPQVNAEENYSLGDVNFNGAVSADDASMVLMEYSRNSTGEKETFTELQKKLADIDKNGKIDATDATMILKYYAYLSTGGKLSFEEYLKEGETPVIQTTTSTTTTQTTIPTTTVTIQPVIEKENYTKYDLLDANPEIAAKAYERLSEELWHELYNGYCFQSVRGGITNGYYECKTFIAILNKNENISLEALASEEALGSLSQEDFEFYSAAVAGLAGTEYDTGSTVDYTKYILNEDLANYINNTNRAWKNYKNGDMDEYNAISDEFFNNIESNNSYVKLFYMTLNENLSTGLTSDESVDYARELFIENVSRPLYESYAPYKGHSYNR